MLCKEGILDKIKIGNIGSATGTSDTRPCKRESKAAAANNDREKAKREAERRTLRVKEKNKSKKDRLR